MEFGSILLGSVLLEPYLVFLTVRTLYCNVAMTQSLSANLMGKPPIICALFRECVVACHGSIAKIC